MQQNNIVKKAIDIFKDSAVFLLTFIGITILLTSILFFFHISVSITNLVVSFFITVAVLIILYREKRKTQILLSVMISILVFAASIWICSRTYDLTWDGNTYHKLAIGSIKDGWNPLYQHAENFIKSDTAQLGIQDDGFNSIWIEHYPKASWIFAANIYLLTNNIEASKILAFLMMYIGFWIILNYAYKKTNLFFSFLIAFFIVVNPISVVQLFNFYIDGIMGICIYLILCTLIGLSDRTIIESDEYTIFKRESWLVLALCLMICINLKFTGLVYSAIFCFLFFVLWLYRDYKESVHKQNLKRYIIYYALVVFVSIGIVGFSPYIKNTITEGNPLYPLMGKNKVDIMTYNEPKSFVTRNPIDKFITSMFGVAENVKSNSTDNDPRLKVPFTILNSELKELKKPDLRISGFGVWFSGIFIISLICILYYTYKFYKDKNYKMLTANLAYLLISTVLIIITEGSWWARYVPYVYLLPIIAIIMLAIVGNSKKTKILAVLISILLAINVGITINSAYHQYSNKYMTIKSEMRIMKKINKKRGQVKVYMPDVAFSSMLYNLRDKHIRVNLANEKGELKEPRYVNFFYYDAK